MTLALVLLAAYPLVAVALSIFDGKGNLTCPMQSIMAIRFLAGVASFAGIAMLVGEYQSKKQMRKLETNGLPNKTPEHISEGRKRPSENAQR
jgi:hypothetical protein